MNRLVALVLLIALVWGELARPAAAAVSASVAPSSFVDPLIGTGGIGFGIGSTPPGAQAPFGMVRLSPDTSGWDDIVIPFNHFGGYYHSDSHIRCFSHTHTQGAGALDYGNVCVTAHSHTPTSVSISSYGYRSAFLHSEEAASPGYYRVRLADFNIQAELTATQHVGVHRYTFGGLPKPGADQMWLIVDISHALAPGACLNSSITIDVAKQELTGWILNAGALTSRIGGSKAFFAARFDVPFNAYGVWSGSRLTYSTNSATGTSVGAVLGFGTATVGKNAVEAYFGISFISVDQARQNLQTEVLSSKKKGFDDALAETRAQWDLSLSVIQVEDPGLDSPTDLLTVFYTALYHVQTAPTIFSEVGGVYLGFDGKVHSIQTADSSAKSSPSDAYYTDMSIWDVHRSQVPLLAIIAPDRLRDIVRSLILMYQQGCCLPRWPIANGYGESMIGNHADIIIADALAKGIDGFDVASAYAAMYQAATQKQPYSSIPDLQHWIEHGYVSSEATLHGACDTLEVSYDMWAVASVAKLLGKADDFDLFTKRSKNYRNVWNAQGKHFCPRSINGTFNCPATWLDVFDPRYVEGDAEHWRWFVPHDVPGLIELFGSRDLFVSELERFFVLSTNEASNALPNPYYWAGNEPDIFASWMFAFAGRPDRTQFWTRWLIKNKFSTKPDGLPGNDDYGTMSAWALFASLGFYPLAGSSTYILGTPLFQNVTVHMPASSGRPGGDLKIIAHDFNNGVNVFVRQLLLNGKPIQQPFIEHGALFQSGKTTVLEYFLSPSPA